MKGFTSEAFWGWVETSLTKNWRYPLKKKYECHKCGKINEIEIEDGERYVKRLRESDSPQDVDSQVLYCRFCGAANLIEL